MSNTIHPRFGQFNLNSCVPKPQRRQYFVCPVSCSALGWVITTSWSTSTSSTRLVLARARPDDIEGRYAVVLPQSEMQRFWVLEDFTQLKASIVKLCPLQTFTSNTRESPWQRSSRCGSCFGKSGKVLWRDREIRRSKTISGSSAAN